jgi:hypothetical protein
MEAGPTQAVEVAAREGHRQGCANRRGLPRCANRCFPPSFPDRQLARRHRCMAAVQPPVNPPAHRVGLQHARASLLCPLLTAAGRSEALSPLAVRLVATGCGGFSLVPSGGPAVPRDFLQTFAGDVRQTARHKPQPLRGVNAGLIQHTPADGGRRGCGPTRPGCTTPPLRFLLVAPPRGASAPFGPHLAAGALAVAEPSAPLIPGTGPGPP